MLPGISSPFCPSLCSNTSIEFVTKLLITHLELVLNGRHRLRIGAGVEGATLPTVLALPASVRIYLCITPCDMRKSFDGFQALAVMVMALDPFDGHLLNQMG